MGKPRRPRTGRSTGQRPTSQHSTPVPKSALDPVPPADPAPPTETAASPEPVDAHALTLDERAHEAEPATPSAVAPTDPATYAELAIAESEASPAPTEPLVERSAVLPVAFPSSDPIAQQSSYRIAFAPERLDLVGIGATVAGYLRGEGEAAASHIRALIETRSPADVIRLQVGEIQRAADASLTCWSTVAGKVSRIFAGR